MYVSSRARLHSECPKGSLLNRKTTKHTSNIQRYTGDCYTLHTFIQGDKTDIEQVFDRQKHKFTDISKVDMMEQRVITTTSNQIRKMYNNKRQTH
jgi:hypothetical protein